MALEHCSDPDMLGQGRTLVPTIPLTLPREEAEPLGVRAAGGMQDGAAGQSRLTSGHAWLQCSDVSHSNKQAGRTIRALGHQLGRDRQCRGWGQPERRCSQMF